MKEKLKIHCLEMNKNGFDKIPLEKVREMVGWIEPPGKGEKKWTVTMSDGCFFDCKTQESAQLLASIEEVKALLMNQQPNQRE